MGRYEYGEPTYEEALEIIHSNRMDLSSAACNDAVEKAIQTLEEANRYRWHDLRKNPKDLPEDESLVIIEILSANDYVYISTKENHIIGAMFMETDDGYKFESVLGRYPAEDVIRWKYNEPLEEE